MLIRALGWITTIIYLIIIPLLFFFGSLDALSLYFALVILVVALAAALYSNEYIAADFESGLISKPKALAYYLLFNLFIVSMLVVVVVDNLGVMWAAIEMTTLISAFLVGFYNNKGAVEAAWKYIIICSAGIILALIGTILFSYALLGTAQVDANLIKVAFIFILVGYGTKAGLAPMHTWLPDAHSQAVSPASALLSGVLLKTSIYAIIRYSILVNSFLGPDFTGRLLMLFGLFSLAVAAGFILVQKDIKRLLAYSSIEHIGIIALGLGLGTPLSIYGALFHVFNHAAAKSLLFFGAGNIVKKYHTHDFAKIKGVLRTLPFTGTMILVGILALVGLPPFSIFFSEMIILLAAVLKGSYVVASLYLFFIVLIFAGIIYHFSQILFGPKPDNLIVTKEPASSKLAFLFLLGFICLLGVAMPGPFNRLLLSAVSLIRGM